MLEEQMREETDINKSVFIRLSGWSLRLRVVVVYPFFLLSYLNDNGYNVVLGMSGGESHSILTQREQGT